MPTATAAHEPTPSQANNPSPRSAAQAATTQPQAPQTTAVTRVSTVQRPAFVPQAGRRRSCGRQRSSPSASRRAAAMVRPRVSWNVVSSACGTKPEYCALPEPTLAPTVHSRYSSA
jgi:hypothetical protein